MVNNIQLTWMLRTYRTCNSTVRFSKYEFYNKLMDDIILFRVTGITWSFNTHKHLERTILD